MQEEAGLGQRCLSTLCDPFKHKNNWVKDYLSPSETSISCKSVKVKKKNWTFLIEKKEKKLQEVTFEGKFFKCEQKSWMQGSTQVLTLIGLTKLGKVTTCTEQILGLSFPHPLNKQF